MISKKQTQDVNFISHGFFFFFSLFFLDNHVGSAIADVFPDIMSRGTCGNPNNFMLYEYFLQAWSCLWYYNSCKFYIRPTQHRFEFLYSQAIAWLTGSSQSGSNSEEPPTFSDFRN
jgi:hypothetical protein